MGDRESEPDERVSDNEELIHRLRELVDGEPDLEPTEPAESFELWLGQIYRADSKTIYDQPEQLSRGASLRSQLDKLDDKDNS